MTRPGHTTVTLSAAILRGEMTRAAGAGNAWPRQMHRAEVLETPPPCYRTSPVWEVRRMNTNSTRRVKDLFRGDAKWCNSCQSYLSLDAFHKCAGKRGGVSALCKKCRLSRDRRHKRFDGIATNCYYCGRELHEGQATTDHVIPRVMGGTDDSSNLVPACLTCNTTKKDHTIEGFRALLERKRDGVPYFNKQQLAYLGSVGFEFPVSDDRIVFWFESEGER